MGLISHIKDIKNMFLYTLLIKYYFLEGFVSCSDRNSAKECISRMLAKIFGPAAAKDSSWCGQRGNFKVGGLNIISTVKGKY